MRHTNVSRSGCVITGAYALALPGFLDSARRLLSLKVNSIGVKSSPVKQPREDAYYIGAQNAYFKIKDWVMPLQLGRVVLERPCLVADAKRGGNNHIVGVYLAN